MANLDYNPEYFENRLSPRCHLISQKDITYYLQNNIHQNTFKLKKKLFSNAFHSLMVWRKHENQIAKTSD